MEESKALITTSKTNKSSKGAKTAAVKSEQADDDDDQEEKKSSQPIVLGKKRKHPASSIDDGASAPTKRRKKNADGSEGLGEAVVKAPPAKKVPPKPTVFKAGKWNPDTVLVDTEVEKAGDSSEPDYSCCKFCNLRNLHRAVNSWDVDLLKRLVADKKNIATLAQPWSLHGTEEITDHILRLKSEPMLEALFQTSHYTGAKSRALDPASAQRSFFTEGRCSVKAFLLHTIDTGNVSHKAYGTAIRAVNVSRGNRQGNNAFAETARSAGLPAVMNPAMFHTTTEECTKVKIFQQLDAELVKKVRNCQGHQN